jgi:hypothetical protein
MTLNEAATRLRSTADELEAVSKAAEEKEHEVDTSGLEATLEVLATDVAGIQEEVEEADELESEEDEDEEDDEEDEEDETDPKD